MPLRHVSRTVLVTITAIMLTTTLVAQDFSSVAGFETWALNLFEKILTIIGDFLIMILREVFAGIQSLLGESAVTPAFTDMLTTSVADALSPAVSPSALAASPTDLIPLAPTPIEL